MRSERRTGVTKKLLTGLLAMAVIISGIFDMTVISAYAANESGGIITPDATKGIQYVPYATALSSVNEKNVPVRKDYVFGGWYRKAENATATGTDNAVFTPMSEKPATAGNADVYAKFVPAYVLSVKMQVTEGTTEATDSTTMRVLSAVDDTNYQEVGFEIYLGTSKTSLETKPVTKVYRALKLKEDATEVQTLRPENTFGTAAKYFSGINLTNIAKANYASIVYVRPYWKTLDGTKIEGLARNLHVEDEYNNYISVPVNILSGEDVAAGRLKMTYDKDKLEVVTGTTVEGTVKGFEAGRLLTEMEYNVDATTGMITIVGNVTTVNKNVAADGLFASIRFKEKEGTKLADGITILTWKTDSIQEFCNWDEEMVTVGVWETAYGAVSAENTEN